MFINDQALILRLLIGHILADFLLQSKLDVREKQAKAWKAAALYFHAGVYAIVIFLASSAWRQVYWLIPALFVSHVLIDGWKASREKNAVIFIADQSGHLAILAVVFFLLAQSGTDPAKAFFLKLWESPRFLSIFLGYFIVLWPVGRLMTVLTVPLRRQLEEKTSRGLEPAGFWIGCLERFFLLTFILSGYPAGAALLLGLKSLFRFGEIRDPENRKETEYILIGTLSSFGFALAVGLAVKFLIRNLP